MATVCAVPAVRLRTRVAADLAELVAVRDALAEALDTCGWSEEDVFRVLICADEAMANALTHGSDDRGIDVRFRVDTEHVIVGIGHGCRSAVPIPTALALPLESSEHGRGLILMRALADGFRVRSRPEATLVALVFHSDSRAIEGDVQ